MPPPILPSRSGLRRWIVAIIVVGGIVALLALVVTVVLIALPLTRRLLFVGLAEALLGGRLETLAVDLDIQPRLKWLFSLIIILPVAFSLERMITARDYSKATRGLIVALSVLLALGVFAWVRTQHFNFDAQGRPVVYLSFQRDGVRKSYYPGFDPVSGRLKQPVSPDRAAWMTELVHQPVRLMNPVVDTNWFDANSGEPNLWFLVTGPGQWQFFNRPHFHQQLQVEVQPITREIMAQWQADQNRLANEAVTEHLRAEKEARALKEIKEREARRMVDQKAAALNNESEANHRAAEARQREEPAAEAARLAQERQQQQERAAAETTRLAEEHQQQLARRRSRESTAEPYTLETWDSTQFLARVVPGADGDHPDGRCFAEEYSGRRFRFHERVEQIDANNRTVRFAAATCEKLRFRLEGKTTSAIPKALKKGREVRVVATPERIQLSHSEAGWEVVLFLSGIEIYVPPSVPISIKPTETPAIPATSAESWPKEYIVRPVGAILTLPLHIVGLGSEAGNFGRARPKPEQIKASSYNSYASRPSVPFPNAHVTRSQTTYRFAGSIQRPAPPAHGYAFSPARNATVVLPSANSRIPLAVGHVQRMEAANRGDYRHVK